MVRNGGLSDLFGGGVVQTGLARWGCRSRLRDVGRALETGGRL